MRANVLLLALIAVLLHAIPASAQVSDWKTLSRLDFGVSADMPGWKQVPYHTGQTSVLSPLTDAGRLIIASDTGAGKEWVSTAVYYTPGFSLQKGQVRLQLSGAKINDWRDIIVHFMPLGASVFAEPAFWINLSSGEKGGIHIRRLRGTQPYDVLLEDLPFRFNAPTQIVAIADSKGLKLSLKQGGTVKEFNFPDVFPADALIKPWTVFVGSSQHGNSGEPARVEISGILLETTDPTAISTAEMEGNRPGKDNTVTYIPLEKVANRRFQDENVADGSDGFTDQGANDLRNIPRGFQFFRGIPFYIDEKQDVVGNAYSPGMVMLRGENHKKLPLETKPIEVGTKATYLYFLHTAAWSQEGLNCADYIVTYDDGSTQTIPLQVGRNIADWWEPKDLPEAKVAWIGANPVKENVGFHLMPWSNPTPEKQIRNIVFRSADGPATPMLIAITASDHEIKLASAPRRYVPSGSNLCEYRQRHSTSLRYERGPAKLTVRRTLPIDPSSEVKLAKIVVVRVDSKTAANVKCSLAGVTKSLRLPKGELRAVFTYQEDSVLKKLSKSKADFPVTVEINGGCVGKYISETNPNHRWIKGGEDFRHGTYDIAGIFTVTGWLPVHKLSGYIEDQPPVMDALPVVRENAALRPARPHSTWVGAKLCLNGPWQWQPTRNSAAIPTSGWETAVFPRDISGEMYKKDQSLNASWFKRSISIPAEWKGKRVALQFQMVADFATVYVNGKKTGYHEGITPFEVDVTPAIAFGTKNTIAIHVDNVMKGLGAEQVTERVSDSMHAISPFKGKAYRMWMIRGAWNQNPDEVKLLVDGKDLGKRVSSIEEVAAQGDGAYYREQFWDHSVLYFSVPGDLPIEQVADRFEIGYQRVKLDHYTFVEPAHHYRSPVPRATGILDDAFLVATGVNYVADVFVRPSFRKMRLDVDLEVKLEKPRPLVVSAVVRDGAKTALEMASVKVNKSGTLTIGRKWASPRLWQPTDPHLYFIQVDLRDAKTNQLLDRRFERFGFREFWVQGTDFMFNGEKFMIQADTGAGPDLPRNRHQVKWFYADTNQQANCNLFRWHVGGMDFPSNVDVADEMGMLLEQENRPVSTLDSKWTVMQVKHQRNHPSIVMWSGNNEYFAVEANVKLTPERLKIKEEVLETVPAIKKVDPTRPVDLHGENGFLYFGFHTDPRVEMLNIHYIPPSKVGNWKQTIRKPVIEGEESLGSDFAWTYQSEVRELAEQGKDPAEHFYKRSNAAAAYIGQAIRSWMSLDLPGIYPFGATNRYHPLFQIFENPKMNNFAGTPEQKWPAESGEGVKRSKFEAQRVHFNIWDPKRPRTTYLRTFDALKDNFAEAPKIRPKLSPELVVRLIDASGRAIVNTPVWLIPTDQPTAPIGAVSDSKGRAWFYCRAGGGKYRTMVQVQGKWYRAEVIPAQVGEWTQVKTVEVSLPAVP